MSSSESWMRAMEVILAYYAQQLNYKTGGENANAFLGSIPPDDAANLFLFIISGGPQQTQNFQCPNKGGHGYLADGLMTGQHESLAKAMKFVGKVMSVTAPLENENSTGAHNRGLAPNVDICEMTLHPTVEEREIVIDEEGEEFVTWWVTRIPFRVVYNNNVD